MNCKITDKAPVDKNKVKQALKNQSESGSQPPCVMEIDSNHDVADRTYNANKQIPAKDLTADDEHAFYY